MCIRDRLRSFLERQAASVRSRSCPWPGGIEGIVLSGIPQAVRYSARRFCDMVCADGGLRQRLAHLARGVPAPSSRAVSEFVRAYEERVDFFMWLQWIADQQLSAAQSAGRDAGMSLGLVCDMAVGVSGAGADALMLGELFACLLYTSPSPRD